MDKSQRTSRPALARLFLIFFAEFLPGLVGRKISYFLNFFYIFLWTRITWDGTTKIFTLNRGGMWATENQERFWKTVKSLGSLETLSSRIFLNFLRSAPNGGEILLYVQNFVTFLLKKIEPNRSTEWKVMPVLPKITQVTCFQRHNSANWPAAVRAKLPYPRQLGQCD